jgi:hypothetical protein
LKRVAEKSNLNPGMSPAGVLSETQKKIRFRKLIQKRRIQGEPIPQSYLGDDDNSDESPTEIEIVKEHTQQQQQQQGNYNSKLFYNGDNNN